MRIVSDAMEALGPARHVPSAPLWWVALGVLVALPIWLAAVIPARFSLVQKYVRWSSVVLLIFPTGLFIWAVTVQLDRFLRGVGRDPQFVHSLALTLICITTYVLLLWPELRRLMSRQ